MVPAHPLISTDPFVEHSGQARVGVGVDGIQGFATEGDGAVVVAGEVGALSGPPQQIEVAERRAGRGARHGAPQLQGPFVLVERFGGGGHLVGG